jgi:hypothetical protein
MNHILAFVIRNGTSFVMQSSSTCWAIVVNDYGAIVSTILALSTFATLLFFVYVLHRTLKCRTIKTEHHQQGHKNSEKHKRKKRKKASNRLQKNTSTLGRARTTNEPSQVITGNDNSIDNEKPDGQRLELTRSDDTVFHTTPQLPPLDEDEPLESPPQTGFSLGDTLRSITNNESQPHLISARLRSASSSTTDSFMCGSLDDQSSCSGRSTPTAIGVNESIHASFMTTPTKQVLSATDTQQISRMKNGTQQYNTPNRVTNQSRRAQNNRRGGKKNSPLTDVSTISLIPSKRWDALKPSNRTMVTRENRQPTSGNSRSQASEPSDLNRPQLRQPRNDINHEFNSLNMATTIGKEHVIVQNTGTTPIATGSMQDTRDIHDDMNEVATTTTTLSIPCEQAPFSDLNPNSHSWTGIQRVLHDEQTYYSPTRQDLSYSADTFTYDLHGFHNAYVADSPERRTESSSSAAVSNHYLTPLRTHGAFNALNDSTCYQTEQSSASTPSVDCSFSKNDQIPHIIDSADRFACSEYPASLVTIPSLDSTMMMTMMSTQPNTATTSPAATSYHHHPRTAYHHVRDNPFATSDEDEDVDQIEADLLELGGQMVGSILDF